VNIEQMLYIGQMARICNVSTKTLRHYDAIGLLSPATVREDTQYRCYAWEQIPLLRRILVLKELGLSLETIRELIPTGSMADLDRFEELLQKQEELVRGQLMERQQLLDRIQKSIQDVRKMKGAGEMHVRLESLDEFHVIGLEYYGSDESKLSGLWEQFIPRIGEIRRRIQPDVTFGICFHDAELKAQSKFSYMACVKVDESSLAAVEVPPGMIARTVPAKDYAVFTHQGMLDTLGDTYQYIYETWLPESGYDSELEIDIQWNDHRTDMTRLDSRMDIYIPIIRKEIESSTS
jgi:predicted transcriptional regulator YdeE/DNA-binding transcriptional MerR regulator